MTRRTLARSNAYLRQAPVYIRCQQRRSTWLEGRAHTEVCFQSFKGRVGSSHGDSPNYVLRTMSRQMLADTSPYSAWWLYWSTILKIKPETERRERTINLLRKALNCLLLHHCHSLACTTSHSTFIHRKNGNASAGVWYISLARPPCWCTILRHLPPHHRFPVMSRCT